MTKSTINDLLNETNAAARSAELAYCEALNDIVKMWIDLYHQLEEMTETEEQAVYNVIGLHGAVAAMVARKLVGPPSAGNEEEYAELLMNPIMTGMFKGLKTATEIMKKPDE